LRQNPQLISASLGIFDEVQAGDANFSGKIKAQRLLNKYGRYGFDYIGNSRIDIPVWRYSRTVYCVKGLSVSLGEDRVCKFVGMTRHHWFPGLITASRPRQWLKNLLVFVPILANHSLNVKSALYSLLAFIVFCLCASSAYLLNDALDAGDDRFHPTKHSRPIANGSLPIHIALLCSAILGLAGLALAGYFIFSLFIVVAIYFISTMAYSLCFKRLMMIDIVVLAMLYSIRVLGGGAATDIRPSFWLIAFSFFMFLSLALLKRYSELHTLHLRGKQRIKGRGYRTLDQAVVAIMGTSSIFVSILVFMLYMNSPNVSALYPNPTYLFAIVPLLVFWAGRLWILAGRGEVNDDPILYVSRDATSLVVIVCCFAFATAASI
jgi:4-hydroxybenzoate polyprenyltransferase